MTCFFQLPFKLNINEFWIQINLPCMNIGFSKIYVHRVQFLTLCSVFTFKQIGKRMRAPTSTKIYNPDIQLRSEYLHYSSMTHRLWKAKRLNQSSDVHDKKVQERNIQDITGEKKNLFSFSTCCSVSSLLRRVTEWGPIIFKEEGKMRKGKVSTLPLLLSSASVIFCVFSLHWKQFLLAIRK